MERKNDELLLKDLWKIYTESTSKKDLNERLNKYIRENKLKKTLEYLKHLLDERKEQILLTEKGTLNYEIMRNTQDIHKNSTSTQTIIKKLNGMSEEEIFEFLKQNKINVIQSKIEKHIQKVSDEQQKIELEELLHKIQSIYANTKDEKRKIEAQKRYEQAVQLFDTMVNRGYFSYTDFKNHMNRFYGCDSVEMERLVTNCRVLLRDKYPEKMEEYNNKIQKNRIRFYILHQKQFDDMLNGIKHGQYDIVDFYINFKLSPDVFIRLYTKLHESRIITTEQKTLLNKFFEKYFERKYDGQYSIEHGKLIECNGTISKEDKEKVEWFMECYLIPQQYFKLCYKKYKCGFLNYYFGKQLKKISQ